MLPHAIFFFGAIFFLFGVLLGSLKTGFLIVGIFIFAEALLLLTALFGRKRFSKSIPQDIRYFFWLGGLLVLILFGALFYTWDDIRFREADILFGKSFEFTGVVVRDPVIKSATQELTLRLDGPVSANVLIKTQRYPEFQYGERIQGRGLLTIPDGSYAAYLEKERIRGIIEFPVLQSISTGNASPIKLWLFSVKHKILQIVQSVLPEGESAFVSGLMIGARSGLSDSFKEAMQRSGTTHLVALSGYNITILVWTVMGICAYIFSRRTGAFITAFVIFGFVLMTGGEASVVRAALMGGLILFANEAGRAYDVRNAILFAAILMVFYNPKVLAFDIGFQLSFLALIGIVYLKPVLGAFFRMREEPGFLSWKDNFLTTLSAQLMVAPLLITQFGSVSPVSLLTNIIILELIPLTMGFGFLVAGFGFISYYLALGFSWLLHVLLLFEIGIIEFFGSINIPFAAHVSIITAVVYYIAFGLFIVYGKRFAPKIRET